MEKTCFKCLRTLPISDYYKHPMMGDGHLGKCKDCARRDVEERRAVKEATDPDWVKSEAERQRKKNRIMNHSHPEIASARRAVRTLGRSMQTHWHHWSYLREHRVDVFALLPDDHRKAHRHMVYDHEQMKYRRASDMILLDTREAHGEYLATLGIFEVSVPQQAQNA